MFSLSKISFPNGSRNLLLRAFSSDHHLLKAYPGYSVFGEDCVLSLKFLPPTYRVYRRETLTLDYSKRGKLLLEWLPKTGTTIDRDSGIRFALTAEETAVVIDQMEQGSDVEIARVPNPNAFSPSPEFAAEKVLRITRGSGGTVTYHVDFEKGGVGGQAPVGEDNQPSGSPLGPLRITVQLGEQKVIQELMRSAIPKLVGWDTLIDTALEKNISDARRESATGVPSNEYNGY